VDLLGGRTWGEPYQVRKKGGKQNADEGESKRVGKGGEIVSRVRKEVGGYRSSRAVMQGRGGRFSKKKEDEEGLENQGGEEF